MIEPPPCSAMWRAARWLPTMTPKRFTAITRSKSAEVVVEEAARSSSAIPALLNMTWSPPKRATAKSTSSWTSSASATSVRLNAAAVAELRRQLLAALGVHVGDDDLGAFFDEAARPSRGRCRWRRR